MAVISSDTMQLAHVKETTPGVTPNNPAFQVWADAGESLVFAPQTSDSTTRGGSGRFKKPSNVTGFNINGGINFELTKFTALDEAIAGVLAANWGECPLTGAAGGAINQDRITVGNDLQTFTIEKRFPNPAAVTGAVPTVTAAAPGAQTLDLTVAGAAAVGTGMVVLEVMTSAGVPERLTVPINVSDDADAVAAAIDTAVNADLNSVSSTALGPDVTLDAGAGNTITSITARAGNDQYFYQRYKGATYSSFSLSIAPNSSITGTVNVVGGSPELDYLPLPGATYTAPTNSAVFTAPQVLELSMGNGIGINTHCWTSLTINLDSQNRGIPCIGSNGDREVVLGTLTASVSGDVYFSDQSVLEALLANKALGDSTITLSNADGEIYRWDFYGMKPTDGQLAAGGAGADLVIPMTVEPTPVKVCDDGTEDWMSGLILSTIASAPVLP